MVRQLKEARKTRRAYPRTIYAHVAYGEDKEAGMAAIQYWMPYFYNDWRNKHEMDWEQVTVFVKLGEKGADQAVARACAFSTHFGAILADWDDLDRRRDSPVVYVAKGSHANYPAPGRHLPYTRFAGLTLTTRELASLTGDGSADSCFDVTADQTTGVAPSFAVVNIPERGGASWGHSCKGLPSCNESSHPSKVCSENFEWMNLKGKWGYPGGILGDAAPTSPSEHESWNPFRWLDQGEFAFFHRGVVSDAKAFVLDPESTKSQFLQLRDGCGVSRGGILTPFLARMAGGQYAGSGGAIGPNVRRGLPGEPTGLADAASTVGTAARNG